tara:strand:+ start:613 stop:1080 length:468 start_codon:yes stop_codon:yes gene_type:complete
MDLIYDFFSVSLNWGDYVFSRFFILFISLFFSILFLQSGIDKLISFQGNLNYFQDHFKNTFFRNQVKYLLLVITFLECLTGGLFIYIFLAIIFAPFLTFIIQWYLFSMVLCLITLSCLFLGQRLAQDYTGAVNLGIYFLIALLGFSLPVIFLELL